MSVVVLARDTILAMNLSAWESLLFYLVVAIILTTVGLLAWVLVRGREARDI